MVDACARVRRWPAGACVIWNKFLHHVMLNASPSSQADVGGRAMSSSSAHARQEFDRAARRCAGHDAILRRHDALMRRHDAFLRQGRRPFSAKRTRFLAKRTRSLEAERNLLRPERPNEPECQEIWGFCGCRAGASSARVRGRLVPPAPQRWLKNSSIWRRYQTPLGSWKPRWPPLFGSIRLSQGCFCQRFSR
jgi:hypothetical protein